jgi:hypothetical protein
MKNDGYGRMTSYTRFSGAVTTEYRPDGYYWAYPLATSTGGYSAFKGPYASRAEAKAAEEAKHKKRFR